MRRPHLLRANETSETPQAAVWFDTETDQERIDPVTQVHHLRFGWLAYARRRSCGTWTKLRWYRFDTIEAFYDILDSLMRPKVRVFAFCHNTNFDLPVLDVFGRMPRRGWKLSTAVIEAPPTILKFRRDKSTIVFLDTLNLWRMPLSALGKMVGLPKLDMPDLTAPREAWDDYAKRDVEVIARACMQWWDFLRENDMGGFAPTLAGQAMRTFRHRYMTHEILIDASEHALSISREAYCGGRVECFHIGRPGTPVWMVDANSMFPYVMAKNLFPARLLFSCKRVALDELCRWLGRYTVCARVTVDTPEPVYPVRRDGKLVFPTGAFTCTLSSPELAYALDHGHLVRAHEAAVYDAQPIFRSFVEDMYSRRLAAAQAGKATESWLWKILMNSLYGKFGQRGLVYETVDTIPDLSAQTWREFDAETGQLTRYRQFCGIVQAESREQESRQSHPAIAAHVTAYARTYLWGLIRAAGRTNTFYVDTDSLVVNRLGYDRLQPYMHDSRLGALKRECFAHESEFRGAKDYTIGDKVRIKGVKSRATMDDQGRYVQDKWSSLRGVLREGDMSVAKTTEVRKALARVYDKGTVGPGGTVTPIVLGG